MITILRKFIAIPFFYYYKVTTTIITKCKHKNNFVEFNKLSLRVLLHNTLINEIDWNF
jgi:hypothetical protein